MNDVVIDTHIAIWYPGDPLQLSKPAENAIDDSTTAFRLFELSREVADEVENTPRLTLPEMPDRIIAATALHLNLPLVTKDHKIQALQNIKTIR